MTFAVVRRLHFYPFMIGLILKMIRFRLGQKMARGTAKKLGLRPVSGLMGIIGGLRMM